MGACEGMTITDPALLMSVMEAREEVEAAGSDRAALQPLLDRVWGLHDDTVQASGGAGLGWAGLGGCVLQVALQSEMRTDGSRQRGTSHTLLDQDCVLRDAAFCSPALLKDADVCSPARRPLQELSAAFAAGDLHRAAELTPQLRYNCRIKEAIMEKM